MSSKDPRAPGVPLVEVSRGAMIESLHRGFIAVVDTDGRVVASAGDIETKTYYRSAAKPFQAIPIIASGAAEYFKFSPQEIAVICGSHSGEDIHLEVVKSILGKAGLTEDDLKCGAHTPFDELTAKRMRAEDKQPTPLHNNCSGKHAGMLAFSKYIGLPYENYIDPEHPIQVQIRDVIARFAGLDARDITIAVDGCSAPVFGLGLKSMALSYARLVGCRFADAEPPVIEAAERVVGSMAGFPVMVGGSRGRLDTDLMRVADGRIISKVGAEGVQLLGVLPCGKYPKGIGIAIKIEDGDIRRARDPVVIETLRQLGALDESQIDLLSNYVRSTVFNHRRIEVGEVRACFKL